MVEAKEDAGYQAYLAQKKADEAAVSAQSPEFYVHLADGSVVKLSSADADEAGSHYDGIAVIARYLVGA